METDPNLEIWEEELPLGIAGGSEEKTAAPIIGTLSEGSLHQAIKNYYQPDASFQEQKVGRFVADIYDANGITEIQTGNFSSLREKLPYYAELGIPTRVVYPLRIKKKLIWQDPRGNFLSESSGRKEHILHFLEELWQVWKQVDFSHHRFEILLVSVSEIRVRYPNRAYGKRKRLDSRLEEVLGSVSVASVSDLLSLLPSDLLDPFSVKELEKTAKVSHQTANRAVLCLRSLGALHFAGKDKNAYLYAKNPEYLSKAEE